ncbi:CDP-diacylglycerol--serine O-phosphatidyltransferase [Catalinimonas alkaloidigena]|uniref:CDP-diacylglycerol--serine O-phosphatidyltransferase n=1 Tax=Catalinimonas alkaloidigena TaxID=1075417 RepID=UPI00240649A0|nr:CDP-diacylglycerol--serine O-phosphatidyltransferase [Catalinimonas alkaloidigena]MDF9797708.1 CDP-diacylglycerol--serine O-phosphatidyltransferase [Catalinimonas alkaloidigena]
MVRYIPNFLTICNLLSGCIGIVLIAEGNLNGGAYMIWLAAIFDFFDGLSARAFSAHSSIGGELDSLSDMVSFGVLPSFIIYALLKDILPEAFSDLAFVAFAIAAFSAIRLAIFNIDTRQKSSFIGLPTPASALLISALPLSNIPLVEQLMNNYIFLILLVLVDSYLLVSNIQLMAFKFDGFGWQKNKFKYSFMLISLILVILLNTIAIPLVILLYIIFSILKKSWRSSPGKSS